jgi:Fe-S-cluster containining protein
MPDEKTDEGAPDQGEDSGPQGPPRFIYECARCGHSCADRNYVEVTLADIRAWAEDQTLVSLFPHLRLMAVGRPYLDIVLASDEGVRAFEAGDVEHRGCPMHDPENKLCNIYHSMPLHCRSYPLGYNGSNYFVKDRECQGLGQGRMTSESLGAHREAARKELEARRECGILLPSLQGFFTRFFVEASARTLEAMSPEDRSRLEELMARQLERGVAGGPVVDEGDGGGVEEAGEEAEDETEEQAEEGTEEQAEEGTEDQAEEEAGARGEPEGGD